MSTVLSAPTSAPTVGSRRHNLNHYVRSSATLAGVIDGTSATALCGETFVPRSHDDGEASAAGAPICRRCSALYERLA